MAQCIDVDRLRVGSHDGSYPRISAQAHGQNPVDEIACSNDAKQLIIRRHQDAGNIARLHDLRNL